MKKIIFLVLILFSCSKDIEYCWLCTETVTEQHTCKHNTTTETTTEICGQTAEQILRNQKDHTFRKVIVTITDTVTINSYLKCKMR